MRDNIILVTATITMNNSWRVSGESLQAETPVVSETPTSTYTDCHLRR